MRCHPPHCLPLHRLLQSSSRMFVNYTLYLSSDSMGNVPHSMSRYRRLLLCAPPRSIKNPNTRSLTRLWSSDFGPQDLWFIPLPSRANSHPQHRRASQPDRTPASVSPFGVVPSRSVYAETDWAPVVLLGSRLGIRSDKPISRHTHFPPLPPEIVFLPARVDERRIRILSANGRASRPPFHFLSASVRIISVGDYRNYRIHRSKPVSRFPVTVRWRVYIPLGLRGSAESSRQAHQIGLLSGRSRESGGNQSS